MKIVYKLANEYRKKLVEWNKGELIDHNPYADGFHTGYQAANDQLNAIEKDKFFLTSEQIKIL